jgi:hypothetical protein
MSQIEFEEQVKSIASGMQYPQTPNISGFVTPRLHTSTRVRFNSKALAWSLTIALVLLSSLMLIPSARAAIIDFFQIGVVRIFPQFVTPTVEPLGTATAETMPPVTATPLSQGSSDLIALLEKIAGKTTLARAQEIDSYTLLIPTYPADLGGPDYVFVQDVDGAMTILVWIDPQHPDQVQLSLHFIPSRSWVVHKMGPKVIRETQVNGHKAIWAEGPYPLKIYGSSEVEFTRLINGHVLIWADGDITYRLETDLSLEEAVRIAESLEPIP